MQVIVGEEFRLEHHVQNTHTERKKEKKTDRGLSRNTGGGNGGKTKQ